MVTLIAILIALGIILGPFIVAALLTPSKHHDQ